jgi:hypothetical protein
MDFTWARQIDGSPCFQDTDGLIAVISSGRKLLRLPFGLLLSTILPQVYVWSTRDLHLLQSRRPVAVVAIEAIASVYSYGGNIWCSRLILCNLCKQTNSRSKI